VDSTSPADARKARVSVRNLTKAYQTRRGAVTALKDVSLDVFDGEVIVLLGPSGCGKTTLLRCVAGLEEPSAGEITVHGQTVYSSKAGVALPPEKRRLSMVFQSYALWPHMSVAQNVAYPLKVSKVEEGDIRDRVGRVLSLTGLEKLSANYPGQLSGGQQQRVALARALVANDGLILFDEPLSNLDAKVRERLRDELITMQQEFGFTAIYVTHDQVEAAVLAHRIAVMEVGEVAQLGSPTEVFNEPRSRYVADFVGCTNELAGKVCGSDGALLKVDTPLGQLLGAPARTLSAGQPVKVMFRPEHGRIVEGAAGAPNTFAAEVERCIFLGSHVEYRLKIAEERVSVRSMHTTFLPAGAPVTVEIDPRYARVFQDA
jgi:iron(III) transport system ATP-binding protein